jgi:lipopolysaccharide cholinephosphotransferase
VQELSLEAKKQIGFKILCDIDEVCRRNRITYYLAYGSLIGAVRHQGFIPWDDDIDIWVPVEEYERFLNAVKHETSYKVLNHLKDVGWSRSFSKVSDPGTYIVNEKAESRTLKSYGVSVDIFPLFYVDPDPDWISRLLKLRNRVVYLQRYRLGLYRERKEYLKILFAKMLLASGHDEAFYKKRIMAQECSLSNGKHRGCVISVYREKDMHPSDAFAETVELHFENRTFSAPCGYDQILRDLYGDYMKLPPPEKRTAHSLEHAFRRKNRN